MGQIEAFQRVKVNKINAKIYLSIPSSLTEIHSLNVACNLTTGTQKNILEVGFIRCKNILTPTLIPRALPPPKKPNQQTNQKKNPKQPTKKPKNTTVAMPVSSYANSTFVLVLLSDHWGQIIISAAILKWSLHDEIFLDHMDC